MSALEKFLRKNSVQAAAGLPLVHSTVTYKLAQLTETHVLETTDCDVFSERLNYFFVGRPAYKNLADNEEAQDWELPCCFIFEFEAIPGKKRIYPFDTGAHHLGMYPKYINMMDREEFESAAVIDAPGKIIGAFFGSPKRYFELKPKDKDSFEQEYSLTVLDAEVKAARTLAAQSAPRPFDDRRFTIEVQSTSSIDLRVVHPLAVILPVIYLENPDVRAAIETEWKAEPLSYVSATLSTTAHYGQIYELVRKFYEDNGFF